MSAIFELGIFEDAEDFKNNVDSDGYVDGEVGLDIWEIIEANSDSFLDLLSENLVGVDLLMDIYWEVRGAEGSTFKFFVSGDASEVLARMEEEND